MVKCWWHCPYFTMCFSLAFYMRVHLLAHVGSRVPEFYYHYVWMCDSIVLVISDDSRISARLILLLFIIYYSLESKCLLGNIRVELGNLCVRSEFRFVTVIIANQEIHIDAKGDLFLLLKHWNRELCVAIRNYDILSYTFCVSFYRR